MAGIAKAVSKGLTKKKKKAPKKKKKVEKVEVDAAERKPITKRQFKKDYEVDIGKPSATEASIRDMPQRKIRGTSGRAADSGSDPIVVGSKSMPSFADINRASLAKLAKLKASLRKQADEGSDAAQKRLDRIEEREAQAEKDRVRKSAVTRGGRKPAEPGTYHNSVTGEVVTIKKGGITAKERYLPLDYAGAKLDDWVRNPTAEKKAAMERDFEARQALKRRGESPEKDRETAKELAKRKKLKKLLYTDKDPKFKRLDTDKKNRGGLTKKSYGTVYRAGGAVKGKAYGAINNLKRR